MAHFSDDFFWLRSPVIWKTISNENGRLAIVARVIAFVF